MLTLITGQPGNGKSLYTIAHVEEMRKAESRPVFYFGIPELKLPWLQLEDPTKWHECPEKSIIVIDEVQKIMPPRPSGSRPPAHVSPLEVHRHKGYDLFFMTQDPSLVDNHIKKLAGEHIHLIRQWGMQRADVFKMQKVQDPTNANLKRAQRTTFKFPKKVFEWYKSADAHTHKRKIPLRIKLALLIPLIFVVCWYFGTRAFDRLSGKAEAPKVAATAQSGGASGAVVGQAKAEHVMTPAQYVNSYAPRVGGLAYTAPVYDGLTKPTRVPVPAACVVIRGGCECWTQQGTRLNTTEQICQDVVKRGFFEAFEPDGPKPLQPPPAQPVVQPVAQPQEVRVVVDAAKAQDGVQQPRKRTVVGSGKARRVDELGAFGDEG
ncbi:hypothetical protein R77560_01997 [Ralstonia thomasii]|uniref:Zona occludens toxin N-terminal domain-containing protein n=2 Tax=Ralstonia TaxID=48736 RepID=A0AAD2BN89_9RALS|nr:MULTISPECIES: zonular occludens toxin domain-containing protein [Ralstonia]CAJ0790347.1 hypothetical protein R77560_01997 [Ralstonia sp. LMG 18095]